MFRNQLQAKEPKVRLLDANYRIRKTKEKFKLRFKIYHHPKMAMLFDIVVHTVLNIT
jgi:hypothetical protein